MESSMNNAFIMSKHETTTFSSDQTPEESSWTMYFEDFFEASSSIVVDNRDCSSSYISDAASFVATKKTLHVSKQEGSNYSMDIKKTRNREIPFGRHHDLEDTASSPSHSPNVYSMMNLLDNNSRHGGYIVGDIDDTINETREREVQNQDGLSVDLKKKGLCLVPLSMVANYLG